MTVPARDEAGPVLVGLAREAVEAHLHGESLDPPPDVVAAFPEAAGVFVTIRRRTGELRGCIGTPRPVCDDIPHEIVRVAPMAATSDPRFPPVEPPELPELHFEVSILTPPVPIPDASSLDPARYGVIAEDAEGRRALLLPGIRGIETVARQLFEIRRKAGIPQDAPIRLQRFEVLKYEE